MAGVAAVGTAAVVVGGTAAVVVAGTVRIIIFFPQSDVMSAFGRT